jgi:hypothetical protein
MQCKDIEIVLEQEDIAPLPEEARAHVSGCVACQNLLSDVNAIIAAAERMPAEIAPPERIWVSLRAQLEAEGIIREQVSPPVRETGALWQTLSAFFRGRAFATAAVGLIILVAALFQIRPTQRGDDTATVANPTFVTPAPTDALASTAAALSEQERDLANVQRVSTTERASSAPVDAALQKNLRELDQFIAECIQHLKQQPNDELAREYLAAAYQQKSELLSAMIDRGRSVN